METGTIENNRRTGRSPKWASTLSGVNLISDEIKLTPDDCDPHMKHGVGKS